MAYKHIIMLLLAFLCTASAAPLSAAPANEGERYAACTALVNSNPAAALAEAKAWAGVSHSVSARHCMALALYGAGQYRPAAEELDELMSTLKTGKQEVWLKMVEQSANAWEKAGSPATAATRLQTGVNQMMLWERDADAVPLLIEQAKLLQRQGKRFEAIHALDHALAVNPQSVEAKQLAQKIQGGKLVVSPAAKPALKTPAKPKAKAQPRKKLVVKKPNTRTVQKKKQPAR